MGSILIPYRPLRVVALWCIEAKVNINNVDKEPRSDGKNFVC